MLVLVGNSYCLGIFLIPTFKYSHYLMIHFYFSLFKNLKLR